MGSAVLSSDHPAETGAGGGEVVFQSADAVLEHGVLGGGVLELVGEVLVVTGEFVDACGQVLGTQSVELMSELVSDGAAEFLAFGSELANLLAG
jgi:hypothetical protein